MIKLFITGYQHSGTTMLMQLLRQHPQVGWIENEQNYIEYDKPKDWILSFAKNVVSNLNEQIWGEKIPFGNREGDRRAERPIILSRRWRNYFGKNARILHIVRHPIDVASSGIADGHPSQAALKNISDILPNYIDYLNHNSHYTATIIYENLVLNPEKYIPILADFLEIKCNEKIIKNMLNADYKFGRINSERVFAYKKHNVDSDVDYQKILNTIKRII